MLFGKYVNQFYKKYWYHFVFGILFLVIIDVLQLFIPSIIGQIVGIFSEDNPDPGAIQAFWSKGFMEVGGFSYYIMCLFSIGCGMLVGRTGWRIAINRLGIKIDRDMRLKLFDHAEQLSVSFYNTQKTGSLMTLFNNDLEAIKSAFTEGIIYIVDGLVLGTLAMVNLFSINWFLALLSIVPLSLMAILGKVIGEIESKRYTAQLNAFDRMSDFAQENFTGIAVIKAFIREKHEINTFKNLNKINHDASLAYVRFSIILNALIDLLIYCVAILIMFVGGFFAIGKNLPEIFLVQGEFNTESLTKFMGYFDSLIWPMIAVGMLIDIKARSRSSLKKVSEFLDTKADLKDVNDSDEEEPLRGEITFKDLNFNYPDSDALVLKEINMTIREGETLGIVGRTGSGKSTLVKVLLKIYNIDDGKLFFDGKDINSISAKHIRNNIGYVAQNAFLFSDLIENNIAFSGESSFDTIKQAASFACVDDSIVSFKDGYKTLIGEKGTSLSGGQKQRIAMARAIVKNPAILILDDSVSAVDSDTETKILANIDKLRKGKTTLIVSSRISVVENLDHIVMMENGQIVGCGTHEELLSSCKSYATIVRLQELEKEAK